MTTKRVKQVVDGIETREEMEGIVERITRATIERDGLMAQMDSELTSIRSRYEPDITAWGQEIDRAMTVARTWAESHPEEFGARKSIDMVHGVVGFRTGTPKLKLCSGWTWNRVLEFLVINRLTDFIRSKQEVDKELILANRDCLKEETLRKIGVKVAQEETFYVEPKREDASMVRKVAVVLLACLLPCLGGCYTPSEAEKQTFWLRQIAVEEKVQTAYLEQIAGAVKRLQQDKEVAR